MERLRHGILNAFPIHIAGLPTLTPLQGQLGQVAASFKPGCLTISKY